MSTAICKDRPVEDDPGIARRCWAAGVQVLDSSVLGGYSKLDDRQRGDVAVTAGDVTGLIEADDLARVVDDRRDLVIAQVVEDVARPVVE